jgi:hypothetical protein
MIPQLQRVRESFDERNAWLQASLGLVSLGQRVERAVEGARARPAERAEGLSRSDEVVLDALLGVVALGRAWRARLEGERRPVAEPREERGGGPSLRELLGG